MITDVCNNASVTFFTNETDAEKYCCFDKNTEIHLTSFVYYGIIKLQDNTVYTQFMNGGIAL